MSSITETITINVETDDNDQYVCQLLSSVDQLTDEIRCFGQTKEHAIAVYCATKWCRYC